VPHPAIVARSLMDAGGLLTVGARGDEMVTACALAVGGGRAAWPPPRRTARGLFLAVAVVAAVLGCTASPSQRSQPSPSAHSAVGSHRVDGDIAKIVDSHFADDPAETYRNRRAVLVTVDGQPLVQRYYRSTPDTTANIQSVGKTIIGTLIGIALDEGHLRSVDQTVAQLLPSYRASMSPQVKAITLRQLLTMTAGLPPDDVFYTKVFDTRKDWARTILADGPNQPPGQSFMYSSAGSHLLSVILSEATGQTVLDYAREKLFAPLGIDTTPAVEVAALAKNGAAYERARFAWPTDPQGHHIGGGGLKLTASDLSKLGQLWLNNGRWADRQLVSAAWMSQSQRSHVRVDARGEAEAYGHQQWVTSSDDHDAFAAAGLGGQLVEVVPDLGLVVVVLSASPGDPTIEAEPGTAQARDYMAIVDQLIAPAAN
jgi:CubicO group peptidase (beta-lactamase class C family)